MPFKNISGIYHHLNEGCQLQGNLILLKYIVYDLEGRSQDGGVSKIHCLLRNLRISCLKILKTMANKYLLNAYYVSGTKSFHKYIPDNFYSE